MKILNKIKNWIKETSFSDHIYKTENLIDFSDYLDRCDLKYSARCNSDGISEITVYGINARVHEVLLHKI